MRLKNRPDVLKPQDVGIQKVGNLELFLDLVFVYTVSQITGTLGHPHGAVIYLHAALMFVSLIWIYDGFTWLTSNADTSDDITAWAIFVAMAGFFMMSLAIPTLWEGHTGIWFGVGLLLTSIIHSALFTRTPTSSARAIWAVAPTNILSALLVLLTSFMPSAWAMPVWLGALLVLLVPVFLGSAASQFSLSPRHFAERHGLLIIVTLGEGIMGTGVGLKGQTLDGVHIGYAVTSLFLSAWLWWSYFGPLNERAEHQLVHAAPESRASLALRGYGVAHYIMLAGLMMAAAGVEVAVQEPLAHAHAPTAWNLAAGLALYFAGQAYFRRVLWVDGGWLQVGLALALLSTVWLGEHLNAFVQLGVCALLLVLVLSFDDYVLEPRKEAAEHKEAALGQEPVQE